MARANSNQAANTDTCFGRGAFDPDLDPKYRRNLGGCGTYLFEAVRDGQVIRTREGLNDEQLDAEVKQAIANGDLYTWWAS